MLVAVLHIAHRPLPSKGVTYEGYPVIMVAVAISAPIKPVVGDKKHVVSQCIGHGVPLTSDFRLGASLS